MDVLSASSCGVDASDGSWLESQDGALGYSHIHKHTHKHTHTHTHTHTHIHTCTGTCTHARTRALKHTHMHIHALNLQGRREKHDTSLALTRSRAHTSAVLA